MRRRLAIIFAASVLGATMLFATQYWMGFALTPAIGQHGGGTTVTYPALGDNDYFYIGVTVTYTDDSSDNDSKWVWGPKSAGSAYVGVGDGTKTVSKVESFAYCVYNSSSNFLYEDVYWP